MNIAKLLPTYLVCGAFGSFLFSSNEPISFPFSSTSLLPSTSDGESFDIPDQNELKEWSECKNLPDLRTFDDESLNKLSAGCVWAKVTTDPGQAERLKGTCFVETLALPKLQTLLPNIPSKVLFYLTDSSSGPLNLDCKVVGQLKDFQNTDLTLLMEKDLLELEFFHSLSPNISEQTLRGITVSFASDFGVKTPEICRNLDLSLIREELQSLIHPNCLLHFLHRYGDDISAVPSAVWQLFMKNRGDACSSLNIAQIKSLVSTEIGKKRLKELSYSCVSISWASRSIPLNFLDNFSSSFVLRYLFANLRLFATEELREWGESYFQKLELPCESMDDLHLSSNAFCEQGKLLLHSIPPLCYASTSNLLNESKSSFIPFLPDNIFVYLTCNNYANFSMFTTAQWRFFGESNDFVQCFDEETIPHLLPYYNLLPRTCQIGLMGSHHYRLELYQCQPDELAVYLVKGGNCKLFDMTLLSRISPSAFSHITPQCFASFESFIPHEATDLNLAALREDILEKVIVSIPLNSAPFTTFTERQLLFYRPKNSLIDLFSMEKRLIGNYPTKQLALFEGFYGYIFADIVPFLSKDFLCCDIWKINAENLKNVSAEQLKYFMNNCSENWYYFPLEILSCPDLMELPSSYIAAIFVKFGCPFERIPISTLRIIGSKEEIGSYIPSDALNKLAEDSVVWDLLSPSFILKMQDFDNNLINGNLKKVPLPVYFNLHPLMDRKVLELLLDSFSKEYFINSKQMNWSELTLPNTVYESAFQLENGLRVYVSNEFSRNSAHLVVNAGKVDESATTGLAHLVEHCVFFPHSTSAGPHQLERIVYNAGGTFGAYTHAKYTSYMFSLPTFYGFIGALGELAALLSQPTFEHDYVNRAVFTIDGENQMGLHCRRRKILKSLEIYFGKEVFHERFGDLQSLSVPGIEGLAKNFWKNHYFAGNMELYISIYATTIVPMIVSKLFSGLPKMPADAEELFEKVKKAIVVEDKMDQYLVIEDEDIKENILMRFYLLECNDPVVMDYLHVQIMTNFRCDGMEIFIISHSQLLIIFDANFRSISKITAAMDILNTNVNQITKWRYTFPHYDNKNSVFASDGLRRNVFMNIEPYEDAIRDTFENWKFILGESSNAKHILFTKKNIDLFSGEVHSDYLTRYKWVTKDEISSIVEPRINNAKPSKQGDHNNDQFLQIFLPFDRKYDLVYEVIKAASKLSLCNNIEFRYDRFTGSSIYLHLDENDLQCSIIRVLHYAQGIFPETKEWRMAFQKGLSSYLRQVAENNKVNRNLNTVHEYVQLISEGSFSSLDRYPYDIKMEDLIKIPMKKTEISFKVSNNHKEAVMKAIEKYKKAVEKRQAPNISCFEGSTVMPLVHFYTNAAAIFYRTSERISITDARQLTALLRHYVRSVLPDQRSYDYSVFVPDDVKEDLLVFVVDGVDDPFKLKSVIVDFIRGDLFRILASNPALRNTLPPKVLDEIENFCWQNPYLTLLLWSTKQKANLKHRKNFYEESKLDSKNQVFLSFTALARSLSTLEVEEDFFMTAAE